MGTHAISTNDRPTEDLAAQYLAIRRMTEELCADISPEDAMLQSMPEASPVKWHLAHTSWFFETFLLAPNVADYKSPNPAFRDLFNSYYNAVGTQPSATVADCSRVRRSIRSASIARMSTARWRSCWRLPMIGCGNRSSSV